MRFETPAEYIAETRPHNPALVFRPHALIPPAQWFKSQFAPTPFYSVKANPDRSVLKTIWESGIDTFDIASINEARLIRELFAQAELGFLHTVKSFEAIRESYFDLNCKIFSLDSERELHKILSATENAKDLTLIIRVAIANSSAVLALDDKFGANAETAAELLRQATKTGQRCGLSFHVGSQAMNPASYVHAIDYVHDIAHDAGVNIDILDIGGGFPALYPSFSEPPSPEQYKEIIEEKLNAHSLSGIELWCEPGRALVSHAESLLTRVEHVDDASIFINDGVYGALHDAGEVGWRFPVRLFSPDGRVKNAASTKDWVVYGPTCDSADKLHHTIALSPDIDIGDYVEFGCVGAYGRAFATRFNGFGDYEAITVSDDPWRNFY